MKITSGTRSYYYATERGADGKARRVYLGAGEVGAKRECDRKAQRMSQRAHVRALRVKIAEIRSKTRCRRKQLQAWFRERGKELSKIEATAARIHAEVRLIEHSCMLAAGYHKHDRGDWRLMRTNHIAEQQPNPRSQARAVRAKPAGKPRLTSTVDRQTDGAVRMACESKDIEHDQPGPELKIAFRAVLRGVECGSAEHLVLSKIGGDVEARAVETLIERASGGNVFVGEAIRRQMQFIRADLAGPNEPLPVRMLADRVVFCWLDCHESDLQGINTERYTIGDPASVRLADLLDRRRTQAQRRYVHALRALQAVQRKAVPTLGRN